MARFIASILLLLLLGACAGQAPRPPGAQPAIASEAACLERGGQWTQLGRAPLKQCLLATRDAGKACTDNAQCQGLCLAPEGSVDGTRVGGTCSADTNRFGCRQQLRDGVPFTLCID
ncbi:MAG TPA: hypothetical protein VLK29_10815 [Luteimonas sp.]|nr:hypothetical protein [Luteimonas sp.]